jgi:hypothetical protein
MTAGANPIAFSAEIENIRTVLQPLGAGEDFRVLAEGLINAMQRTNPNALTQKGLTTTATQAAPAGVGFSVSGANGVFTASMTDGAQGGRAVWKEVSYSPLKSFTSAVTTLPLTTANSLTVPIPGASYFFRIRVSFDQVNWSGYTLASSSAIDSGLVSSAATAPGAAFNQTNYGVVTSVAVGASADIEISGANGPLTSLPAVKGAATTVLPSATISGVTPGSSQFVGWNGKNYVLAPTLAAVLADNLTPIGAVSVVGTGAPALPTVVPIISGGQIIGYNVTAGGGGASAPYTLTLATFGPGVGATFGTQTIVGGVLISVAPGNPGTGYPGGTTVVVSGGIFPGTAGGGGTAGGNGGRMTAV